MLIIRIQCYFNKKLKNIVKINVVLFALFFYERATNDCLKQKHPQKEFPFEGDKTVNHQTDFYFFRNLNVLDS